MNTVQHGLICASWKGYLEESRALLNEDKVDVNAKGDCDNTTLLATTLLLLGQA